MKARSQTQNAQTGDWTKRDREDGEFVGVKKDAKPFKGIAKEADERQDKKPE